MNPWSNPDMWKHDRHENDICDYVTKFCVLYFAMMLTCISLLYIVFQHFLYLFFLFAAGVLCSMLKHENFFDHSTWNHIQENLIITEIFLYHLNHYLLIFWFLANTSKIVALCRNLFIPHLDFVFHKIQMSVEVFLFPSFMRSLFAIKSPHIVIATQTLMLSWNDCY